MKRSLILLLAFSALSVGLMAQKDKKKTKQKLSKADKEFLSKQADGIYAKMETNRGDIFLMLEFEKAPMTVANFVGLAEGTIKNTHSAEGKCYFDSLKFHRIISGFMIQGGCPNGNGSGDPGYSFDDEMDNNSDLAKEGYKRGVLAMANRGPNTNGSQFFIMHKDYPLPPSYTIFGKVVQGIEVVDTIAAAPKGRNDVPKEDQMIKHIEILRKGKAAEAFDAPTVFETSKSKLAEEREAKAKAEKEAMDKTLNETYGNTKTTASGLRYIIEKEGEGANPTAASTVTVHYTGTLLNGTKFDSSVDRGQPATFGLNQVIPGWTEGLQLVKPGGKIKLIIPPNLGYGERGAGGLIPPNSWLVFDVELISIN